MPMYWMAAALLIGLLGYVSIDRRRLRELLPIALLGLLLSGLPLSLPEDRLGFVLAGTGPLTDHFAIALKLQVVAGPIFAVWFVQGVETGLLRAAARILAFAGICLSLETMAWDAGRLRYATWWDPAVSLLSYVFWFTLVWGAHRLLMRMRLRRAAPASGAATRN